MHHAANSCNLVLLVFNMKKLCLSLCAVIAFSLGYAQSFTVATDYVSFSGLATASDISSPWWNPVISNTSGDTLTLRWVRVEENIPGWWRSSVCTELYCYSIPDDSATWTLLPGDIDMMYIHIYPYGYTDTGNVVVKLFDVNNPADSVRIMFHADVLTEVEEYSSISALTADPLTHQLNFTSNETGQYTLTDVTGRVVTAVSVQPGQVSFIEVHSAGVYFFTFVNDAGEMESRKLML